MISIIASILTSLLTGGVIWYSEIKSKERLRKEFNGKYLLKASLVYKVMGIVLIVIAIVLINVMVLHWNEEIQIIAPIVACLFLVPGVLTMMFYYNYNVEFDELRIIATNWRGVKRVFKWNDISKVKYIDSLKCLRVKSATSSVLINYDSVGFITFIEMLELKTDYKLKI